MKWKVVKPIPKARDIRRVRVFAWWPVRIDDYMVWLEYYESVQIYYKAAENFKLGDGFWKEVEKELYYDYYC